MDAGQIIDTEAVLFWGSVWSIGFAASLCRTCSDHLDIDPRHLLAVASTCGFLAFAVVGFTVSNPTDNIPYTLAIAASTGLVGRRTTDAVTKRILDRIFAGISDGKKD